MFNKILTVAVLILLVISALSISVAEKATAENKELKKSVKELLREPSKETQVFNIGEKELNGKLLAQRDSIAKELEIKPNQITVIQKVYLTDTIHDTVEVQATECKELTFAEKYKCMDIVFAYRNGIGVLDVQKNTDISVVEYWERRRLFGKKFLPKWGKKEGKISLIDNCDNDTIIENYKLNIQ